MAKLLVWKPRIERDGLTEKKRRRRHSEIRKPPAALIQTNSENRDHCRKFQAGHMDAYRVILYLQLSEIDLGSRARFDFILAINWILKRGYLYGVPLRLFSVPSA